MRALLFGGAGGRTGGEFCNDALELDGETLGWLPRRCIGDVPPPRAYHTLTPCHPAGGPPQLVLFGGWAGTCPPPPFPVCVSSAQAARAWACAQHRHHLHTLVVEQGWCTPRAISFADGSARLSWAVQASGATRRCTWWTACSIAARAPRSAGPHRARYAHVDESTPTAPHCL
jgi:hypothetical protein